MGRTRVFVSYSHEDHAWLHRFRQHVAVLVRQNVIDVWSDNRIEPGVDWKAAIDRALTSANVAVLLVSPAFLASAHIWSKEMPLIMDHGKNGMDILPLLVRPCAWRLAPDLARLQARPTDDRALSTGSESDIDQNLAALTYELEAKITSSRATEREKSLMLTPRRADDPIGIWAGYYNKVRPVRLVVSEHARGQIRGQMEYPNEGTVTTVEGITHKRLPANDPIWTVVGGTGHDAFEFAMTFGETGYKIRGGVPVSFDGEYRVIAVGREMSGGWFAGQRSVGAITLRRV